jgi:superfamily I DNA/RNA helicase
MNFFNEPKTKILPWTKEQLDIFDTVYKAPEGSVIYIQARAGSGKSAVLEHIAEMYDMGLYLAFNKSVVEDMLPRLNYGWTCKTFNSYGLMMCRDNGFKGKVYFNKNAEHIEYNMRNFSLRKDPGIDDNMISGNEMLYWPITKGYKSRQIYDILLIDEAVDMNPLQLAFIKTIHAKKIVFVGDNYQNIYGFNGAVQSLKKVLTKTYKTKVILKTLSESFRCPQEIIEELQGSIPNIISNKTGGEVYRKGIYTVTYPDNCLILARHNTTLFQVMHSIIAKGQHFNIKPKFIQKIKNIIKDSNSSKQENVKYYYWIANKKSNLHEINEAKGMLYLWETYKNKKKINTFLNTLTAGNAKRSKRKITTIHSAKGLESNDVYYVGSNMLPSILNRCKDTHTLQQEVNLNYVAITRSLRRLTYVDKATI